VHKTRRKSWHSQTGCCRWKIHKVAGSESFLVAFRSHGYLGNITRLNGVHLASTTNACLGWICFGFRLRFSFLPMFAQMSAIFRLVVECCDFVPSKFLVSAKRIRFNSTRSQNQHKLPVLVYHQHHHEQNFITRSEWCRYSNHLAVKICWALFESCGSYTQKQIFTMWTVLIFELLYLEVSMYCLGWNCHSRGTCEEICTELAFIGRFLKHIDLLILRIPVLLNQKT